MAPTDLEDILKEFPDQAFRLTLSSGDQIDIPHSGAVRISGTHVVIFPDLDIGGFYTSSRPRYVSTVNIAMVEPVVRQPSPSNN